MGKLPDIPMAGLSAPGKLAIWALQLKMQLESNAIEGKRSDVQRKLIIIEAVRDKLYARRKKYYGR